jgi:hypothetical protein
MAISVQHAVRIQQLMKEFGAAIHGHPKDKFALIGFRW